MLKNAENNENEVIEVVEKSKNTKFYLYLNIVVFLAAGTGSLILGKLL